MKLLINADDLGYTVAINRTIVDLYRQGLLSSCSLLVNMPASQDALTGLRAYPDLGVGVHLNLTKGNPLLPADQVPTLVKAGAFWPTKLLFAKAFTRLIKLQEVEAELRTQIEWVLARDLQPTHLDTHSHWHLFPDLRELVDRLGKEYQIPGMRQAIPRRTLLPSRLWLKVGVQASFTQIKHPVPDYLLSLHQWMRSDEQPIDLFFSSQLRNLIACSETIIELVVHPGRIDDPDFPPDTLLTHQRQWEFDFLRSKRFQDWLKWMEARIVNYQALQSENIHVRRI